MSKVTIAEVAETVESLQTKPSPIGVNGGGCGNPFARQVAALRRVLLEAVSPDDLRGMVSKLVELAKDGHVAAAKIVLEYTLGKPAKAVEPDQLDIEEWQHFKATAPMMREGTKLSTTYNAELPVALVRSAREANTHTQNKSIAKGLTGHEVPTFLRELREMRSNRF